MSLFQLAGTTPKVSGDLGAALSLQNRGFLKVGTTAQHLALQLHGALKKEAVLTEVKVSD